MNPEYPHEDHLKELFAGLSQEQPSSDLIEGTMDRIFALERKKKSSARELKLARLTGGISGVLTLALGVLMLGAGASTSTNTEVVWDGMTYLISGGLAALILWQIDTWLTLFMMRKPREAGSVE